MNVRHFLFTSLSFLLFAPMSAFAQIEVHDNGKVSMGGNILTRPDCHTFINGSHNTVATLYVDHRNTTPYSQAINASVMHDSVVSFHSCINYGAGTFYVAGQGWIFSQGMFLGSDTAIKKDIKAVDSALAKISKIGGYNYYLKPYTIHKGRDSGKVLYADRAMHMGILAQQVEEVAPYAVKELENGIKAVDYLQIIPLLIQSVKELDSTNKIQAAEIALINARYNKLMEDLDTTGGAYKFTQTTSTDFLLYQNQPNPFSQESQISYDLKSSYSKANIYIFDLQGSLKQSFTLSSSSGSVKVSSSTLQPGMYLYTLVVDGVEIDTKRMLLTP